LQFKNKLMMMKADQRRLLS